jgi:hypothetical protein
MGLHYKVIDNNISFIFQSELFLASWISICKHTFYQNLMLLETSWFNLLLYACVIIDSNSL